MDLTFENWVSFVIGGHPLFDFDLSFYIQWTAAKHMKLGGYGTLQGILCITTICITTITMAKQTKSIPITYIQEIVRYIDRRIHLQDKLWTL